LHQCDRSGDDCCVLSTTSYTSPFSLCALPSRPRYLREKADRLAQENRILRRSQRAGKRDEVILQLETELQAKEDEVRPNTAAGRCFLPCSHCTPLASTARGDGRETSGCFFGGGQGPEQSCDCAHGGARSASRESGEHHASSQGIITRVFTSRLIILATMTLRASAPIVGRRTITACPQ